MKVSISEAARLTGKTRDTIYRHIKTGKLSVSRNGSGAQEADISELIRVYGNINQAHKTGSATDGVEQHKAHKSDDILALEIKMLREQQAMLLNQLEQKEIHINDLRSAMLLLRRVHQ